MSDKSIICQEPTICSASRPCQLVSSSCAAMTWSQSPRSSSYLATPPHPHLHRWIPIPNSYLHQLPSCSSGRQMWWEMKIQMKHKNVKNKLSFLTVCTSALSAFLIFSQRNKIDRKNQCSCLETQDWKKSSCSRRENWEWKVYELYHIGQRNNHIDLSLSIPQFLFSKLRYVLCFTFGLCISIVLFYASLLVCLFTFFYFMFHFWFVCFHSFFVSIVLCFTFGLFVYIVLCFTFGLFVSIFCFLFQFSFVCFHLLLFNF